MTVFLNTLGLPEEKVFEADLSLLVISGTPPFNSPPRKAGGETV